MTFFLQFYDKFIFNGKHNISDEKLKYYLIETKDYNKLIDSLGVDNYVRNEVIREAVFLQGMKDVVYIKKYDNQHICEVLRRFSIKTKFKEHKQIALQTFRNIQNRQENPKGLYNKAYPGTRPLKSFSLPMILCNLSLIMEDILGTEEVNKTIQPLINEVMEVFYLSLIHI